MKACIDGTYAYQYLWYQILNLCPNYPHSAQNTKIIDYLEEQKLLSKKYFPELPDNHKKRYLPTGVNAEHLKTALRKFNYLG